MTRLGFGLPRRPACIKEASLHQERFVNIRIWTLLKECKWIESKRNLLILGPSGIGKTYIASALVFKAIECGFFAFYASEPKQLLQSYEKPAQISKASEAALLVIDEFSPAGLTATEQDELALLLDARDSNGSTVITTRLPIPEWNFYPRLLVRLEEFLSNALVLELRSSPCMR